MASPKFSFPGTPYSVQTELMTAIHSAITDRHIALLESPTGTGKTLSIICASLTWLQQNRLPVSEEAANSTDEPSWITEQSKAREGRDVQEELHRRKDAYRQRVKRATERPRGTNLRKGRRCVYGEDDPLFSDDEGEEMDVPRVHRKVKAARIVFATRTHTQLTQFLEELRKTTFCPPAVLGAQGNGISLSLPTLTKEQIEGDFELPLSVMPFGSRKQFCINEEVRALESSAAISERCRELTEAPSETTAGRRKRSRNRCEYKNAEAEAVLRDRALVHMQSIEELGKAGKSLGACPYFATRAALETGDVDVIAVPYSAVLHAKTRESLGIEVDDNTVVVFDEAHNIVNTVCDLHSSVLTRGRLVQTIAAVKAYVHRYEKRFSARNLFNLRQLVALGEGLLGMLPGRRDEKGKDKLPAPKVVHPAALLFDAGVDNINLFVLVAYMEESNLAKKLHGFVDSGEEFGVKFDGKSGSQEADVAVTEQRRAKQSISSFQNFIQNVADCPSYGRVALYPYRRDAREAGTLSGSSFEESQLGLDAVARFKYFVTEPGDLFSANVGRARAILLLGGTLSPRSAIKDALLSQLLHRRTTELECEHVVPADHVLTRICATGPTGAVLEFTHKTRQTSAPFDELGRALETLLGEIPGGVVVFFASYETLRQARMAWERSGMLGRLRAKKPFFSEARGESGAFDEYRGTIRADAGRGAVLAAVMGGRLSEGINFADELGRAVVVVGMPFGDARRVEVKERMGMMGSERRVEFLENECMTVVNQCVGRVVRHRADFAAVLLMDKRFTRERVREKLPRFVRRGLQPTVDFADVKVNVKSFFNDRTVLAGNLPR
ncbi:unnamed protein product [Chondrus crispus]|uniref:Helicase ATP-binding domain-containing protein n=1 Tax=Chondrus crispus TaxID=2769 RepID=R7Q9A1_CHOCR|nr:unnamed protein product [Chondrus crispus]CDF34629.1 unnamed protein product [Chondrus crispus]|eukprot:XP_005714448.1 unnamed protein product [Chondrus crispus]